MKRLLVPFVAVLCALAATAQTPNSSPGTETAVALTKLFNAGMDAFKAGDYSATATNLEQVIAQAGPGSQLATIYYVLGAAYFNLGKYSTSVDRLKTFRQKYPANPQVADATYAIAQASLLNKDYEEAAAEFGRLEGVSKYRANALRYEAMADKAAGHLDKATAALEKLIAGGVDTASGVNGAMELAALYVEAKEPIKR